MKFKKVWNEKTKFSEIEESFIESFKEYSIWVFEHFLKKEEYENMVSYLIIEYHSFIRDWLINDDCSMDNAFGKLLRLYIHDESKCEYISREEINFYNTSRELANGNKKIPME